MYAEQVVSTKKNTSKKIDKKTELKLKKQCVKVIEEQIEAKVCALNGANVSVSEASTNISVSETSVSEANVSEASVNVSEASVSEASVSEESTNENISVLVEEKEIKIPKKRGRKPKGGKIISNNFLLEPVKVHEPNIIMHLKCGESDLVHNSFENNEYDNNMPVVETFQFENNKTSDLGYCVLNTDNINDTLDNTDNTLDNGTSTGLKKNVAQTDTDENKHIWNKLKDLTYKLHTNSISDKKSACFWCTCDFDNPTILIPKFELNKTYHCYGCFCSPECATAYLFKETIDTSTRFERYHLLNHIYCKIYDYTKNIKPAPNPFYTLNKYYGNLSIQEYRKLLKNERLLLIVDKPLSRILPELHEDNDDYMFNGSTISTSNKFKLRRKTKQTKTDILSETFNLK